MDACMLCPRRCGVDRSTGAYGFCGAPYDFRVARIALHPWEEPCISGTRGSGTVFFSGCNLQCVYCQNRTICRGEVGRSYSEEELLEAMGALVAEGAHNVNLVTPTPYAARLVPLLRRFREVCKLPIVYNCGGYESVETLRMLRGLVDVYLPDCKYLDGARAAAYSQAPDYYEVAEAALAEMLEQVGPPVFDEDGLLRRGVLLRHLVLPGGRKDSIALLERLYARFGNRAFRLSLMNQYTPDFAFDAPDPVLRRRVTSFEYCSVAEVAQRLDFLGYFQERTAVGAAYTPDFENEVLP